MLVQALLAVLLVLLQVLQVQWLLLGLLVEMAVLRLFRGEVLLMRNHSKLKCAQALLTDRLLPALRGESLGLETPFAARV